MRCALVCVLGGIANAVMACGSSISETPADLGGQDSAAPDATQSGSDTGAFDSDGGDRETGAVSGDVDANASADSHAHVDAGCDYPAGPYSFLYGNVVPPMSWPSAIAGTAETLAADLAVLHCDPSVKVIFVQVIATDCPGWSQRMAQILSWRSTWELTGAKWIFAVMTTTGYVSSSSDADAYVTGMGIDFGYRTDDADNAAGGRTLFNSGNFQTVPWTGVIRQSTMELVCDEPDGARLDLPGIATALAANPDADLSSYCARH
jgi:hypothetical protein